MRVLLVQPASNIMKNRKEGKPALQPMGLAYIAGTLIENGYKDVQILDVLTEGYYNETPFKKDYIRYGLSPKQIKLRIKDFNPDIIGVSIMASIRKYQGYEICKLAKEVNEDIITVVGGNHVTCFPKEGIKEKYVDFAVLGEGEKPFLELVQCFDTKKDWGITILQQEKFPKQGIAYKRMKWCLPKEGYDYIVKPQKQWDKDVDKIPYPAHHLLALNTHHKIWNKEGYHYYPAKKFTSMLMARGCPMLCEHCPHDVLFKGYRSRSAQNIFNEVKKVHTELGVEEIQFHEYNALVDWDVVKEFCRLMIESGLNKKITWGYPIGIWLKPLTYEKLKYMREAGMTYVDLPIESANQDLLLDIMKGKNVDLKHALDVIKWSRKLGYYINCFFMLGLEGQDKKDIENTIRWSSKLDVDTLVYFIAQPLPGTPFWNHSIKKKTFLLGFDTFHLRYGKSNTKVPGITPKELEDYRHKGRQDFLDYWKTQGRVPYKGPRGSDFLQRRGVECGVC